MATYSIPGPRPRRPEVQPAVHIRPHRPAAPAALAAHAACTLPALRQLAGTLAALPARGHMETLLPMWGPGSLPPLPGLLQKGRGTPAQADPAAARCPRLPRTPHPRAHAGPNCSFHLKPNLPWDRVGGEGSIPIPPHPARKGPCSWEPSQVGARRGRGGSPGSEGQVETRGRSAVGWEVGRPFLPRLARASAKRTWCGFHDKDTDSLCGGGF